MRDGNEAMPKDDDDAGMRGYEAPDIEAVLTPEALEREILYSGDGTPIICS
jgi:hypothetical protein